MPKKADLHLTECMTMFDQLSQLVGSGAIPPKDIEDFAKSVKKIHDRAITIATERSEAE